MVRNQFVSPSFTEGCLEHLRDDDITDDDELKSDEDDSGDDDQ